MSELLNMVVTALPGAVAGGFGGYMYVRLKKANVLSQKRQETIEFLRRQLDDYMEMIEGHQRVIDAFFAGSTNAQAFKLMMEEQEKRLKKKYPENFR